MFQILNIYLILACFALSCLVNADMLRKLESDTKNLLEIAKGGKVVAFGDTLTSGLHFNVSSNSTIPLARTGNFSRGSGRVMPHFMLNRRQVTYHPYSLKLGELMGSEVVSSGLSGDTLVNLINRLPSVISSVSNVKVVVILGVASDIAKKTKSDVIISNILSMHKLLHNTTNHLYTVALTIPAINFAFHNHTHRGIVNEGIRKYAKLCSHRVALLELDQIFQPFNSTENRGYWSDRVHFSTKGYDKLGEMVYNIMKTTTFNTKDYNKLDC